MDRGPIQATMSSAPCTQTWTHPTRNKHNPHLSVIKCVVRASRHKSKPWHGNNNQLTLWSVKALYMHAWYWRIFFNIFRFVLICFLLQYGWHASNDCLQHVRGIAISEQKIQSRITINRGQQTNRMRVGSTRQIKQRRRDTYGPVHVYVCAAAWLCKLLTCLSDAPRICEVAAVWIAAEQAEVFDCSVCWLPSDTLCQLSPCAHSTIATQTTHLQPQSRYNNKKRWALGGVLHYAMSC